MDEDDSLPAFKFFENRFQNWVSEVYAIGVGKEYKAIQPEGIEGTVELSVQDGNDGIGFYSLTLSRGSVTIQERPAESPHAQVSGTISAWIEALAPGGDRSELQITGDSSLASALLDSLAPQALGESVSQAATV